MVDSKENYKFDLAGKKLNRGRLEMGLKGGRRILVVSQQKFTRSLPTALQYSKDSVLFAVTFLYKLYLFSLFCGRGGTKRVIAGKKDKPNLSVLVAKQNY